MATIALEATPPCKVSVFLQGERTKSCCLLKRGPCHQCSSGTSCCVNLRNNCHHLVAVVRRVGALVRTQVELVRHSPRISQWASVLLSCAVLQQHMGSNHSRRCSKSSTRVLLVSFCSDTDAEGLESSSRAWRARDDPSGSREWGRCWMDTMCVCSFTCHTTMKPAAPQQDARKNQYSRRSCGSHVKTFSSRGQHCWERMPEDTEGLVLEDKSQQSSTRVLPVSRTRPPTPTTGGCLRKDHLPTAVRPTAAEATSKATHCHLPRLPKKVQGCFRTRRGTFPRTRKKRFAHGR